MVTQRNLRLFIFWGGIFMTVPLFLYGNYVYYEHRCQRKSTYANADASLPGKKSKSIEIDVKSMQRSDMNYKSSVKQLVPGLVPSQVFYIWCRDGWFEFKHYLSILSVIKTLMPQRVIFYYKKPVPKDRKSYYQWIDDLKHDNPFFIYDKMPQNLAPFCEAGQRKKIEMIMGLLNTEGGLYMSENTWIYDLQPEIFLKHDFVYALEQNSTDGFVMMRDRILKKYDYKYILGNKKFISKRLTCARAKDTKSAMFHGNCITVKGRQIDNLKPMNIWHLKSQFGKLARKIYYNTENIVEPKPSFDTLVPNIGHIVWIGGGRMDFLFYLSALSLLYVVEVETLYIHGDKEPRGENWDKLKTVKNVKFVRTLIPWRVYQQPVEKWKRALMSDIIRVDLMIKYGGIYMDTDAIWVKKLTLEDRGYDAVASYDWVDWYRPYPDTVNFGLSYGKKNAPFWRLFQESMRTLHNNIHGFTGVMHPYKILEKHPDLLRIDKRLQVICYRARCHPLWVPDYHNMTKDHVSMNSIRNWRKDVYAFHWTHPNPPEYKNISTLLKSKGMFADIGRYVLKKAEII